MTRFSIIVVPPSNGRRTLQPRTSSFQLNVGQNLLTTVSTILVLFKLSSVMRKHAFCICENKGADQLRGNHAANQHLCLCYKDSTCTLLPKSKISSLYLSLVVVLPNLACVGPDWKALRQVLT